MHLSRSERGYTVVELLTVVAILSVLAGIIFSVIGGVRARAKHASCADNLHQVGTALMLYASDHEGWLPPATTEEFVHSKIPGISLAELRNSPTYLRVAMKSYVKSDAVWFCPADAQAHQDALWLGQRHRATSFRFDPFTVGQALAWPPRMQVDRDPIPNTVAMSRDVPLVSDAVGIPATDSDPLFQNDKDATSNHPDGLVNAVHTDLSLSRIPAGDWLGATK